LLSLFGTRYRNEQTEDKMSRRTILIAVVTLGLIADNALAQHIAPSALLTIDQNRATVVERIVGEWGDRLASSNVGIASAQLRQILSGLRSDHLLAASLAGSVEGLRDVVSGALVRTDVAVSRSLVHTKSLGDTTDDLVYTPVVPCRIVDTRLGAGGVFLPQTQRDWLGYSPGGFASQGGSATNCGIPVRPVAVMMNTTLANTVGGPEFFTLWPFNQTRPTASTVNWWGPAQQPANAEIVPLCTGSCTADFSAYASGQTHAIIDVLGYFNRPTNYGGTQTISGLYATDSGGFGNTSANDDSTVGGGLSNNATGVVSTVAGGDHNTASGLWSTVGGGEGNNASNDSSTVPGGQGNVASGVGSFAAGISANATHNGSFVWGDGTQPANSTGNNTFSVLATGGVGLFPGAANVTIVWGNGHICSVTNLSSNWSCSSDRGLKENFKPIDGQYLLRRLAAMPVTHWNFKGHPETPHIGPVAQDFHSAFGLSDQRDDTHIDAGDAIGVALAAIQGLHQQLTHKSREIAELKGKVAAVDTLKRKLLAIEAKLGL
jgi:Chaperone of endosialidase